MKKTMLIRGLAVAAALLLSATTASVAAAAGKPAHANPRYVALGDSYAAGYGAGGYLDACGRSMRGYPALLAAENGYALDLQACSGATIADVANLQLGTLSRRTNYVTITVGGNDVGFGSVTSVCLGTDTTACLGAVAASEAAIATVLPGRLDALFAAVKQKAPRAKVVVTDYPRLFNGTNCSIFTDFTATETVALNQAADQLADALGAAATKAGFGLADVRAPFVGHAVCDAAPWINNLVLTNVSESYHPNSAGYASGYRPVVGGVLAAKPGSGPMSFTTGGITSTDTTRGQVRVTR